jgi:CBS domain-containing protein
MKVHEVMTGDVESCDPGTDLAAAAMIMWRRNCGVVPIVERGTNQALGVITDRDICMALATRHRRACDISVGEVFAGTLHACRPDDDIQLALEIMRTRQVRRVPIVDADGRLLGILSLNDLMLRGQTPAPGRRAKIADDDLLDVMRAICEPAAAEAAPARPARRRTHSSVSQTSRAPSPAYARRR